MEVENVYQNQDQLFVETKPNQVVDLEVTQVFVILVLIVVLEDHDLIGMATCETSSAGPCGTGGQCTLIEHGQILNVDFLDARITLLITREWRPTSENSFNKPVLPHIEMHQINGIIFYRSPNEPKQNHIKRYSFSHKEVIFIKIYPFNTIDAFLFIASIWHFAK